MVFSAFVESVLGSDSRENLMGIWYAMATGCFLYSQLKTKWHNTQR